MSDRDGLDGDRASPEEAHRLGRRIAIVGSGGAGKSTLARALGETLGLPVHHLDAHFWRPGWTEPPRDEWDAAHAGLLAAPRWIIDGNYGSTMEARLAAAETVIFLDLPWLICLWRIVRRRFRYIRRTRPDMAPGCHERLTPEFVRWVWRYPVATRPRVLARLAALSPSTLVLRLRSPRDTHDLLRSVRAAGR